MNDTGQLRKIAGPVMIAQRVQRGRAELLQGYLARFDEAGSMLRRSSGISLAMFPQCRNIDAEAIQ